MNNLKEKWLNVLPILLAFLMLAGILYLLILGLTKMMNPIIDNRTPQEIMLAKYKQCIEYSRVGVVELCKNYLLEDIK